MERILTGEDIQGFYAWLKAEEKSQNTIEKYARDVATFIKFLIEYVTANGAAPETGCSLFLRKKIADNPADLAKLSTETGGGEPPTPSVVYLNLERTEYELCGLVRLLIMGKQTLKKGYKDL